MKVLDSSSFCCKLTCRYAVVCHIHYLLRGCRAKPNAGLATGKLAYEGANLFRDKIQ